MRSAPCACLRNSSNTSITFLAIVVASFIVVVDRDFPYWESSGSMGSPDEMAAS